MGRIIFSRFNYRAGGKGRGREGEGVREEVEEEEENFFTKSIGSES